MVPGKPGEGSPGLGGVQRLPRPLSRRPPPSTPPEARQAGLPLLSGLGAPSGEDFPNSNFWLRQHSRRLPAKANSGSGESWRPADPGGRRGGGGRPGRRRHLLGSMGRRLRRSHSQSCFFGEVRLRWAVFSISWRRTTSIVSQGQSVSVKRGTVTPSGRQRFRFNAAKAGLEGKPAKENAPGVGSSPGAHVPAVRRRRVSWGWRVVAGGDDTRPRAPCWRRRVHQDPRGAKHSRPWTGSCGAEVRVLGQRRGPAWGPGPGSRRVAARARSSAASAPSRNEST